MAKIRGYEVGGVEYLYKDVQSSSEIIELTNDVKENEVLTDISPTWEQGGLRSTDGATTSADNRIRTNYKNFPETNAIRIVITSGYKAIVYLYGSQSVSSYIGRYSAEWATSSFDLRAPTGAGVFRVLTAKTDETSIVPDDGVNIGIKQIGYVDKTLSETGKPADAKAVGDAIADLNTAASDLENKNLFNFGVYANSNIRTNNGVTYTRINETQWTATNTSTATSRYWILDEETFVHLRAGGKYKVVFASTDDNITLSTYKYVGSTTTAVSIVDGYVTIPNDATGFMFRLNTVANKTVNATITFAVYSIPEYVTNDYASRKLVSLTKKVKQTFTPFTNIDASGSTGAKFTANTSYTGIPYSAMNWANRDVLFDLSLESLFTAFKNPYSDLYSYNWQESNPKNRNGDLSVTQSSGAVWAGAVCSTWVSWATNRPFRMVVDEIGNRLTYKQINGVEDLEVGDVMIQDGHAALINGLKTNQDGEIIGIEVSEMWTPLFRTIWYSPSEWWNRYLDTANSGARPFQIGRFSDDYTIKSIPTLELVNDLISNKGDNANFNLGEDIWIYATDSNHTITVIAPNGTTSTVDYTTLPKKDNAAVYNFKSVFNTIGEWKIKGAHGTYPSRYTIYQLSGTLTASESNGTTSVTAGNDFICNGASLVGYEVMQLYMNDGIFPISASDKALGYWGAYGTTQPTWHKTATALPITNINTTNHADHFFIRLIFKTPAGFVYHNSTSIHRA